MAKSVYDLFAGRYHDQHKGRGKTVPNALATNASRDVAGMSDDEVHRAVDKPGSERGSTKMARGILRNSKYSQSIAGYKKRMGNG